MRAANAAPAYGDVEGPRWRWAFFTVAGVHIASIVFALVWGDRINDSPPAPPAAFLIDLTPASPQTPVAAPPAPETSQAQEQSVPEPQPEPQPEEIAQEAPIPPAEEAVAVDAQPTTETTDQPVERETETDPDTDPDTTELPEQQASEAAAPTSFESEPAPTPVAPELGASDVADPEAIQTWQNEILARLERLKRYPRSAQRAREEGVATVGFTMTRAGVVVDSELVESSGSSTLDEEALALIIRAQPFPAPPPDMPGEEITLVAPVQFFLE